MLITMVLVDGLVSFDAQHERSESSKASDFRDDPVQPTTMSMQFGGTKKTPTHAAAVSPDG